MTLMEPAARISPRSLSIVHPVDPGGARGGGSLRGAFRPCNRGPGPARTVVSRAPLLCDTLPAGSPSDRRGAVMASVNKVILIGNLGRDPEVRYTQGGTAVANFTLATNEVWTDKGGERQERTEWHRIVVWGKQAEIVREHLTKGKQVYIEGSIQTRQWDDREGNKRQTTEIKALRVVMLGRPEPGEARMAAAAAPDAAGDEPGPPPEDDIPF